MSFFKTIWEAFFDVDTNKQRTNCGTKNVQQTTSRQSVAIQQSVTIRQSSSNSVDPAKPSTAPSQPVLVKEPDDLGTPDLPRPDEVTWLRDSHKTEVAIDILWRLGRDKASRYYWEYYYVQRGAIEEIMGDRQEQSDYDCFWREMRDCWKLLRHPFWSAYIAGHLPSPQVASGHPELVKESCILDLPEFKYRQVKSLLQDGVYTLGTLQRSLFNDHWQPADIGDRDKWYFRKILAQYGLEVPPSDECDPVPFAEQYIAAVFGVKKRLSYCEFIRGDEPFEDRVRRIQENRLVLESYVDTCEDMLLYLRSVDEYELKKALHDARRNLKVRKILAGGDYPEARSSIAEGVNLDELTKVSVGDLALSSRAKHRIQKHFRYKRGDVTLADLVQSYEDDWLLDDSVGAAEVKEYLYQHGYIIRPEDMPMDERTPIAYLGLPTRIRKPLRYPGHVETVDDLVRCCSGDDPVFSLRDVDGLGKKGLEVIRTRLIELGFLTE